MTIRNNFLFQETLRNERLCKYFLNRVLHIQVKSIRYMDTEKTMKAQLSSKDTRLDVYVEDKKGNVADIEMQVTGSRSVLYNDLDEELSAFLHYVDSQKTTTRFTKELDKEVIRIRTNDDWRLRVMTLDMEIQDMKRRTAIRERKKGKEEGRRERAIEIVKDMLADGMDIDKVVKFTKLSKAEVAALT